MKMPMFLAKRVGPFDRLVISSLLLLAVLVGLVVWRGDQVGGGVGGSNAAGVAGRSGLFSLREPRWLPNSSKPGGILYLGRNGTDKQQLMLVSAEGDESRHLTSEPNGVAEYALSPDGSAIAYVGTGQDNTDHLYTVDAGGNRRDLLTCADTTCSGLSWSADGERLIFEKRQGKDQGSSSWGNPHLRWIDPRGGPEQPLLSGDEAAFAVSWSRDGRWMSYYSVKDQGVRALNLVDGRTALVPSDAEAPGAWSPTGEQLIVPELRLQAEGVVVHLLKADLAGGEVTDMAKGEASFEDSMPAWSPDGQQIAFRRGSSHVLVGPQLWVMKSDGSDAHALTDDSTVYHGAPTWSPDGSRLLFHCFPVQESRPNPEIWTIEMALGRAVKLADDGWQPGWLP